jgi:hypothetical protein
MSLARVEMEQPAVQGGDSPAASARHVRVLRTQSEIEAIRPVWEAWPGHRDSDIDVYLSLFKCDPDLVAPHVAVVYEGDRPDAILVGSLSKTRLPLRVGYLRVLEPAIRALNLHYGGQRGSDSEENSQLLVGSVLDTLRRNEADVAVFQAVREDSSLYRAASQLPGILSRDHCLVVKPHRNLRVPDSVSAFHKLRPRARGDRNRYGNRLKADFGSEARIDTFTRVDQLDRLVQDVEQIARSTYQRGLGVGFSDTPRVRQLLADAAEKGWLRGYVMYVADIPCAFLIGSLYQNRMYLDFVGYDSKYSRCSPGQLLLIRKIEDFCTEKIEEVNFGIGDAWYKEYFSNETWQEGPVHIFRSSLRGSLLNAGRTITTVTDKTFKHLLQKAGLLANLKKAWRRHAAEGAAQ